MNKKLFLMCAFSALFVSACDEGSSSGSDEEASCINGTYSCQGNSALMQCLDNRWVLSKTCTSTQKCNAAAKTCSEGSEDSTENGCVAGTRRCNSDNSAIEKCNGTAWVTDNPCDNGTICNQAKTACVPDENSQTQCTNGMRQCDTDGSRVIVCANGNWITETACDTTKLQFCDDSSLECKDSCTNGEIKCSSDSKSLIECVGNRWTTKTTCGSDESCSSTTKSCEKSIDCIGNASYCEDEGDQIIVCQNNHWAKGELCKNGKTCMDGACVETTKPACTEGASSCDNNKLTTCTGGKLETTDCSSSGKVCATRGITSACETPVCTQNACKDAQTLIVCNVTQNTKTENKCGTGNICDSKTNACVRKTCDDGEVQCFNNNLETCSNNEWVITSNCGNKMCSAADKKCVDVKCHDGDTRCNSDGKIETCSNNAFINATACSTSQICQQKSSTDAQCVKRTCTEGAYQCNEANLQKCEKNEWVTQSTCDSAALCSVSKDKMTGTCKTRECENGTEGCSNKLTSTKVCVDYVWKYPVTCSHVSADAKCRVTNGKAECAVPVCKDGFSCDGNTLRKCANDEYIMEKDCGANATCSASTGSCVANECAEGAYMCSGNLLRKCESGQWITASTCTADQTCTASSGQCVKNECTAGQSKCDGKVLYDCNGGKWSQTKTCASNETCDASTGLCVKDNECTNGFKCDGNTLYACNSGSWELDKSCPTGTSCNASVGLCAECAMNSYQCKGQDLYNCKNYKWVKQQTCTTNETCQGSMYGGACIPKTVSECTEGKYQCSSNTLQVCVSGKWTNSQVCDASTEKCDATNKTCTTTSECTSGNYKCDANTLYTCVSGHWNTGVACGNDKCDATAKKCVSTSECTNGQYQCSENTLQVCSSGKWTKSKDCTANQSCTAAGTSGMCVDNLPLPEWCNIQWVDDDKFDRGYGRVLIPADVNENQMSAELICGNLNTPVSKWYAASAYKNSSCSDCGANTEYLSTGLNAPAGSYACAFRFNVGTRSAICTKGGSAPTIMTDTTTLTEAETFPITINNPASSELPSWCWFKHLETSPANYGEAYAHIYPADLNGGQIKAELICGNPSETFSKWTVIPAVENVFCPANTCGNNIEFMTAPQSEAIAASKQCAFRVKFNNKTYLCPTEDGNGTNLRSVTNSSKISDGYARP